MSLFDYHLIDNRNNRDIGRFAGYSRSAFSKMVYPFYKKIFHQYPFFTPGANRFLSNKLTKGMTGDSGLFVQ